MSIAKKPLKPSDFPVNADAKRIKKQDGTPIANTEDPAVAADVAERLNDREFPAPVAMPRASANGLDAQGMCAGTTAARNSRRYASREPHGLAVRYSISLVISSATVTLAIDISDWFGVPKGRSIGPQWYR